MHGINMRREVAVDGTKMDKVVAELQSGNGKTQMDAMRKLLAEIDGAERVLLEVRSKKMEDIREITQVSMIAGTIFAAILAGFLGLSITRSITRPLAQAVQAADKLSAGDLSGTFKIEGKDEAAALLTAMQSMQGSLSSLITDINA
jgi:methyl-accepting chemotaxis protein